MSLFTAARSPLSQVQRLKVLIERLINGTGGRLNSIAILSAHRSQSPHAHNRKNRQDLEKKLKAIGCGFKRIVGHGQEENGKVVREPSFVVFNISFSQAKDLWGHYDQWGIIYIGTETKSKPLILGSEPTLTGQHEDVVGELGSPKIVTPGQPRPRTWSEIPDKKKPGYGIEMPFIGPGKLPGHTAPPRKK